jgi:hypothetical protein
MRTFLAVLGGIFLLLILSIGILVFIGMQKVGPLQKEADAYANESIKAIATSWDGAALMERASPELKEALGGGELEKLIDAASQFGPMISAEPAKCQILKYEYSSDAGELAGAECHAAARFARGSGQFKLTEIKRDGNWALLGFWVNGEVDQAAQPVQVNYAPPGDAGAGVSIAGTTGLTVSAKGVTISFAPKSKSDVVHADAGR